MRAKLPLHVILPVAAAALGHGQTYAQNANQSKPNVLFICIDDLRTQIGAYGHQEVITPNLDKLANDARLFTNHYVQVPTSGASRAAMLTGKNAKVQADTDNFTFIKSLVGTSEQQSPETFVHHLRRNGYYTVGMGKVSHSDSGHRYVDGQRLRELPFSWDEFVNFENSPWPDTFDAMLHGYDNGRTRVKGETPAFEFRDLPDTCYADGRLGDLATEQLERLASQQEPFFMAVGFYKPHLPFTAPKKYWDMYEDAQVPISPNVDAPENVDDVFLHNSNECFNQYYHPEIGGAGKVLSAEYSRDFRRAYYSALTYTDAQVGKLLDKFHELGLDKNTIIIVWGDHGWHLGDHTLWGKHSTFERALNSTLIVRTPEMENRGEKTSALVATVDIYPTLCELTNTPAPEGIDGKSFAQTINDPESTTRDYVVSYWSKQLSIRDSRYRMSLFDNGAKRAVMLFDHDADPNETVNVAQENPDVVQRLTEELTCRNNGFLPNL